MPFAGLGLHIIVAMLCALHAVRTGQQLYWLFILFAFPILGSVVYVVAVYLPNSRLEQHALKAAAATAKAFDPTKDIRGARAEFEHTPTAQNQMRLAQVLLDAGEAEEAARLYESCLTGPFAGDPDIRMGAARAYTECQRYADAIPHLQYLASSRPDYRAVSVLLLQARCLAGTAQDASARAAFESAVERFGTFDAYAEYEIWALATGDTATATRLQAQIDMIMSRWNNQHRQLNGGVLRRLKAARNAAPGNA